MEFAGVNKKNKHHVVYPDIPSAIKPVPHGPDIPVPSVPMDMDIPEEDDVQLEDMDTSASYQPQNLNERQPKPLCQAQLNDLTRDLGLSKESAQLLGSRLNESNLLASGTTYFWYRKRDEEFRKFFSLHENSSLVYCSDIGGLVEALGLVYSPVEWRLFIDSSTRSLKAVLLNIGNKIASVPVAHSTQLTESYEHMKILLSALKYSLHNWKFCGDLKVKRQGPNYCFNSVLSSFILHLSTLCHVS